jgi:predicted phosphodiesterase
MFASDIHGSRSAMEAILRQYKIEGANRLVLLGDLLYHGPRNDLPDQYDPKGVTALLNGAKNELLCVRGNCDAEVDQMVLEFPIQADYALFDLDGTTAFVTHGHLFNTVCLPPHKDKNRYLFYRNAALQSNSKGQSLTVVYMEGHATLDQLKKMFK